MSTTTTHIDNKPSLRGTKQSYPLVPELRFNEFDGDWNESRLNDVAEFKKGKGISKADISEDGVLECIRYGELYTTYTELIQDIVSKTNLLAKDLILSEFNDVIIPASGELNIDIATASCVLKSGVAYSGDLNIIRSKMDGIFLSFYLNNKRKFDIARLAQGVSVVHLYSSQLKTLKLNFPSLPEQQKIASFLSTIDEKIQQLTKKKELLEQYKKGVMQQLFPSTGSGQRSGQLRFKPARPAGGDENLSADRHDGNPYPEWKEKKISQVVTEVNERTIENNQFEVLSSTKSGIVLQSEYFNKQVASSDSSNYKIVRKGMFSYRSMSDTGSFTFNIQNVIEIGIVSPAYPVFKVNENQSAFYLYLTLNNSSHFKSQLLAMMEGGTRLALGFSKFKKMIVHLPSFEEQQKIATYLSSIDTKIEAVNTQITQTQTFKKGLLQQMFV
jgi:type I restriction enzyme S subunit